MSGALRTQVPGTAGVMVGAGLSVASAVVKWTLTAESRATAVAPGAGLVDTTARWAAGVGVALAVEGLTFVTTRAAEAPASRTDDEDDGHDDPGVPGVAPAVSRYVRHLVDQLLGGDGTSGLRPDQVSAGRKLRGNSQAPPGEG